MLRALLSLLVWSGLLLVARSSQATGAQGVAGPGPRFLIGKLMQDQCHLLVQPCWGAGTRSVVKGGESQSSENQGSCVHLYEPADLITS